MIFRLLVPLGLLLSLQSVRSQDLVGVATKWSDSFREWSLYTWDEDRTGDLYLRWSGREDWTQWDMRLGDTIAEIKLKWQDNPNEWQIRCLGTTAMARTLWNGDFREWRIDDGKHKLVWKSRYANQLDEWQLRDDDDGSFRMYTYWERDPREWVIEDALDDEISYAMRLALIFVAIFHSTPKV